MALRLFREWMKYLKWVLWLVVAAFIFALFFDFGTINLNGAANRVAVTVGDEEVTFDEFRRQHNMLENRYRQMFGEQYTPEIAKQFNIPQQVLDQLISRRVLVMEAEKIGLTANDKEVQDYLIAEFKGPDGKFIGKDALLNYLASNQLSQERFADMVREDLMIRKLEDVLSQTAYLPDSALERAYRDESEKAKIRYVQLPGTEVARNVQVSDGELQAYFAENSGKYRLSEQRVIDVALVDNNTLRQSLKLEDSELKTYYDGHQDEFRQEEQVRARHILLKTTPTRDANATRAATEALRRRIEAGEPFDKVARENSEDESNAPRGGDLGTFSRNQMVKPFSDAAFGAQVGQVVGPVQTDFGFHLIEVLDKQAGGVMPFEQAKAIINSRLTGERIGQLSEAKAKELKGKLGKPKTAEEFKAAAEKEGAKFETLAPIGENDVVPGYGRVVDLNKAVFKLKEGELSDAIKVPRGWVVARLAKINAPRVPELAEVRDRVKIEVERKKQREAAKARLAQARAQIASGQADLNKVAEELGLQVAESVEFGRFDSITGINDAQAVIDQALELEVGALSQPAESAVGAVLFEVMERKKYDRATFTQERERLRKAESEKRVSQMRTALIEQRRREMPPQVDARLVEDYGLVAAAPAKG